MPDERTETPIRDAVEQFRYLTGKLEESIAALNTEHAAVRQTAERAKDAAVAAAAIIEQKLGER